MENIKLSRRLVLEEIRRISFRDELLKNKLTEFVYEKSNLSKFDVKEGKLIIEKMLRNSSLMFLSATKKLIVIMKNY